ncbi:carboxymuconolactone decarboxylase family protein [Kribbella sp. NPDC056951]|uniref:carboxymuconolactone decarboxylase family protein n=1 Tax=Kribbella sp. NPDC056951 TaxID=3345978 RepID=UPI003635A8B4
MSTTTTRRVKLAMLVPEFYQALNALDEVSATGLDANFANLIRTHASQLNGCAYCTDMHSLDYLTGEGPQQKLNLLPVWRESRNLFTEQEQAALELTEAITLVSDGHVPDAVYNLAAEHFDQKELAQLIALIIMINAWNRVGITGKMAPGHYKP